MLDAFDAHLLASEDGITAIMADGYLAGDDLALLALHDYVEEQGQGETDVIEMLEVDRRYLFKTYGMYYDGIVDKMSGRSIRLRDVTLVVDQGDTGHSYETNSYVNAEKFPANRCVILNTLHVYAIEER